MPTKNDLFIDTSGWLCYIDSHDGLNAAARAAIVRSIRQGRRLITTNYVVAELVALLSMSRYGFSRQEIIAGVNAIKADSNVDIVHVDEATDAEAWRLLEARPDKDWSLVDAISFVLMKRFGMTEALTTDHHFTQAQFVRLLVP
ncbi:MAG TPA: PIN domain-containing protein [Ktedonobacterales bacterium]